MDFRPNQIYFRRGIYQRLSLSSLIQMGLVVSEKIFKMMSEGGVFAWRDGPLLQALKAGHWIVLDEVLFISLFNVL
jgi:midasin (ATPase involved in ribosome maturation)